MIIANPIYDVVFKYLLEDIEIARELLAMILGEDIINIEIKPHESATETTGNNVSILRFDFKAVIKTNTGELKKVLIELQKAKQAFDVMRFRRYLADNYKKDDDVLVDNDTVEKRPLPIVTIYFLGFPLDNIHRGVVKVNREYRDVITQELLEVREDFVELLTHDSYLIQVRLLVGKSRTTLERVLQVFSPEYQTEDKHQMDFKGDVNEPLVKKIVDRLGRAIASDEIREKMDIEDDIDRAFARELGKKDRIIAEKDLEILIVRQKADAEAQRADAETQKAESERQRAEAQRQKAEAETQRADTETQKAESERQRAEAERQKAEAETQRADALMKEIAALKEQLKK
jgi:hypothetical protein